MDLLSLPKVVLHEHLDGGLRPLTILELAHEQGYTKLPTTNPDELAQWFAQGANKSNLVEYLRGFEHTCALLQQAEAIQRVAHEAVVDAAKDGAVYIELRYAPELMVRGGLSYLDVIRAVDAGLNDGMEEMDEEDHIIEANSIICAMRQDENGVKAAKAALDAREDGLLVVGFDIAGPEDGFRPSRLLDAFKLVREGGLRTTVHAGEAAGIDYMMEAMNVCGAERFGHGVRVTDDLDWSDDEDVEIGPKAQLILDRAIPLEMCPSSNVHTGAVASIDQHPVELLMDLGFNVTINTDNRLMSNVTMTSEFEVLEQQFGFTGEQFLTLTLNAMDAAFAPMQVRSTLIDEVILPMYEEYMDEERDA